MDPSRIGTEAVSVPLVDLAGEHGPIAGEISDAVSRVLQNGDYILGSSVSHFEEAFAAYCDANYAVGVDSGTSALELILRAYEIGPGQEVITAPNSFIASALAISQVGASPVFADVAPETYSLDAAKVRRAITSRTRAVIPVHLYGHPADMDPLLEVAQQHNLLVIEDACQAHGARYKGRRTGALGNAAAFSFYPTKNLGACGDSGMVVTNDKGLARTIKMLRNYGQEKKNRHVIRGYNHRLDTIQAAILDVKLKYLDGWNDRRREHARLYNRLLQGSGVVIPYQAEWSEPAWHLYVIRVPDRNFTESQLARFGIATGVHYPVPIHLQPAYADLEHQSGDFPVAETYAHQVLSLPMYPGLSPKSIEYVCEVISQTISAHV